MIVKVIFTAAGWFWSHASYATPNPMVPLMSLLACHYGIRGLGSDGSEVTADFYPTSAVTVGSPTFPGFNGPCI